MEKPKIKIWEIIKKILPFGLGLAIGLGIMKNKYAYLVLILYVVAIFAIHLFAKKAGEIKSSADKKIALRNAGMEAVNNAADYIGEGNSTGRRLFDNLFPKLSIFMGVGIVFYISYLIYVREWIVGFVVIFVLFLYIILINIWRKVKYLGVEDNG